MKFITRRLEAELTDSDVVILFVKKRGVRSERHPLGIPLEGGILTLDLEDKEDRETLDRFTSFLIAAQQEAAYQKLMSTARRIKEE